MRLFLSIIFMFFLSACSDQTATAPEVKPGQAPQAAASTSKPALQREPSEPEKQEPSELAKSENLVTRNGKTLVLHLMSDKKLELTNLDTCDSFENCLIHVYRGLVADKQFFLVENQLYEGSHTRVFSRKTGDEYEVFATPHVSPDGKFLVTASDSEAGQAGVFLWAISEGALTPRFASNSKDYELFRFVRWDGSDKVELMKTIRAPDDVCKGKLIEFPVRLAAREEEWKLEGTFEKDKMVCNP